MATFGIVVGGGPAPGINGVIGAAALTAHASGARVLGILDGMKHVMEGRTDQVRELRPEGAMPSGRPLLLFRGRPSYLVVAARLLAACSMRWATICG